MRAHIEIKSDEVGERLDSFLAKKYPDYSRSFFTSLIKKGLVQVNSSTEKPSYQVKNDDQLEITFPIIKKVEEIKAQKIPLDILYEDENVIVINKKAGIAVHPGAGNLDGTLVNALINYFPLIKDAVFERGNLISESRPGIVHRLDKDTSGVMIVAKNDRAMHSLAKQIQNRTVKKIYLALCFGWPTEKQGELVNYLGRHPSNRKMMADIGKERGKEAISDFNVKHYYTYKNVKLSLIEFCIHTGRTHQIRVQSKILGNPVIGDEVYGTRESIKISRNLGANRQMLHAHKLAVTLPGEDKKREFIAPLPDDISFILKKLQQES